MTAESCRCGTSQLRRTCACPAFLKLRRLPPEYYRGKSFVHWSMSISDRKVGWLTPALYYKFREIFTHTAFRYGLCCPIYCCMPDHLHLLWTGFDEGRDQRIAAKFFRRQLNIPLCVTRRAASGTSLRPCAARRRYRQEAAFQTIAEYIARNPERAGLVPAGQFRECKQTSCLVPGYPDLSPWQKDRYWEHFWRLYSRLCRRGLQTHGLEY